MAFGAKCAKIDDPYCSCINDTYVDPLTGPSLSVPILAASYAAHWIASTYFPASQQGNVPG